MSAPTNENRVSRRNAALRRAAVWSFRLLVFAAALALFAFGSPSAARAICQTSPLLFLASLAEPPGGAAFEAFSPKTFCDLSGVALGLGLGVLIATFFKRRFFCRFLCPLGTAVDAAAFFRRRLRNNALRNGFFVVKTRLLFVAVASLTIFSLVGVFFRFSFGDFSILAFDPLALLSRWAAYFPNVGATASAFLAAFILSPYFWRFNLCPCGAIQDVSFFGGRIAGRFLRRLFGAARRGFETASKRPRKSPPDSPSNDARRDGETVSRRRFLRFWNGALLLAALGAGRAALEIPVRLGRTLKNASSSFFRPPGAIPEGEFLTRCARCGRCVDACPTRLLRPIDAGSVSGETPDAETDVSQKLAIRVRAGVPRADFRDGVFCEKDCVACSNACPTGALTPLEIADKSTAKIAKVEFELERCLLYYQQECSICRRECPFEAIDFLWSEEEYASLPVVDDDKCVGCGRCVAFCPGEPIFDELSADGKFSEGVDEAADVARPPRNARVKALKLRPLNDGDSTFDAAVS